MIQGLRLSDIQLQLSTGKLTVLELVDFYLEKCQKNATTNAYLATFEDEVREQAFALQNKIDNHKHLGKLFGLVCSIKDVICYENHEISAGSKMLSNFSSVFSSTAVEKLLQEDAIIIGRTNCDEFAMGSDNTNSHYGPVRNLDDLESVPGGSSGGAAVSVQMDSCLVALGSDTGGSVRQPAAFCGLIGFKPSYGRISRHGLIAYASSFDQIGLFGRHIEDIQTVYHVCQGPDDYDSTCIQKEPDVQKIASPYTFGILEEAINHPSLDPDIRQATISYLDEIKRQGHQIKSVSFELLEYLIPAYYILTCAEASSNLSRYDGIRYGHRSNHATSLDDLYKKSRTEGFGDEVKRRILLGTFVLSEGYYDAYYAKAQKVRRLIVDQLNSLFGSVNFLVLPTSPVLPWKIGDQKSPVEMYLSDIYSVIANLAGIPGISIPVPTSNQRFQAGLQFLAPRWQEKSLFEMLSEITG